MRTARSWWIWVALHSGDFSRLHGFASRYLLGALLLTLLSQSTDAAIRSQPWGATSDGIPVRLYRLSNANGQEISISNFGGIIVSWVAPDREGRRENIVDGFGELPPYLRDGAHYGATIGRYADRIAGAHFTLAGEEFKLTTTNNATVQSHGGPNGYFRRVWDARPIDGPSPSLVLSLTDPSGEMGFPGTLQVEVRYTLTSDNALRIEYHATTDRPTVANFTNHSYFKLQGDRNGTVDRQLLKVNADRYLPTDRTGMPTGEEADVGGTAFDFRTTAQLGPRLQSGDPQVTQIKGIDHTFIVRGRPGVLREAARLTDPDSGRVLEIRTTQPGVQIYTANSVRPAVQQSQGYVVHGAVAFETQHFPNSPNEPKFPSTVITPAHPLHEVSEFRLLLLKRRD